MFLAPFIGASYGYWSTLFFASYLSRLLTITYTIFICGRFGLWASPKRVSYYFHLLLLRFCRSINFQLFYCNTTKNHLSMFYLPTVNLPKGGNA